MMALGKTLDLIKLGAAGLAGGLLTAGLVVAWVNLVTIPAAESAARQAGIAECEAAARQASIEERERQQRELMRTALEDAAAIRRQAARSEDFQRQLMELAHDAVSSPGDDACRVNIDGVRGIVADVPR